MRSDSVMALGLSRMARSQGAAIPFVGRQSELLALDHVAVTTRATRSCAFTIASPYRT